MDRLQPPSAQTGHESNRVHEQRRQKSSGRGSLPAARAGWVLALVATVAAAGGEAQTFTLGQIAFGNGSTQLVTDPNLFWDNTNKRLGIGRTPAFKLDVSGSARFASTSVATHVFSATYLVPTVTAMTINLYDGVSTLQAGYQYRIKLVTAGTAVPTGAVFIVYRTAVGTWAASMVSANGTTSNHPLLQVTGTTVQIYHNHASSYYLATFVEGFFDGGVSGPSAATFFGLEGAMTNLGGNVGVGTMAPRARLDVLAAAAGSVTNTARLINNGVGIGTGTRLGFSTDNSNDDAFIQSVYVDGSSTPHDLEFGVGGGGAVDGAVKMTLRGAGGLGIGTSTPIAKLDVLSAASGAISKVARLVNNGTGLGTGVRLGFSTDNAKDDAFIQSAYVDGSSTPQDLEFGVGGGASVEGTVKMTILGSGNVGIGTTTPSNKLHVAGSVTIDVNLTAAGTITGGTINAKYQDVAEWVPAREALRPGTVVVVDGSRTNGVMSSGSAYDTRVAGVVSESPGVVLGEAGEGKTKVATTGRVIVRVSAAEPIQVGDLLVTSSVQGVAMKSIPLSLGGVPIHRPGTLIGKALEPLSEGEGEILVLLSLQ